MLIHEALERHLKALTAIKVYCNIAPEGTKAPYIVYMRYGTQYSHVLDDDSGYNDSYFQIDIYATTAKGAATLAKNIRKSLMNFSGNIGTTETDIGVNIQSIEIENEIDTFESEVKLFRVMQEYKITYIEEV